MSKPASFPFLAIAHKHDVSYADVLAWAEIVHQVPTPELFVETKLPKKCQQDITSAVVEYERIQDGKIDWQTGEAPEPVKQTLQRKRTSPGYFVNDRIFIGSYIDGRRHVETRALLTAIEMREAAHLLYQIAEEMDSYP